MVGYKRTGFKTEIDLEDSCKIINDWFTGNYSIISNGREIAANDATFCQIDDDRVACFSRYAEELEIDIPKGWNETSVVARALFIDHREAVPVKTEEGKIIIPIIPGTPVIIYRNEKVAKMHDE
jgi:hypothetical protein